LALDAHTFSCTDAELVFLAALSGADHLIGTPDPFRGWLTEEIGPALMQARDSLARRDVIIVQPDGSVTIAADLAPLLEVITKQERSFLLTHTPAGGEPTLTYFHLAGGRAVEQIPLPARQESTLSRLDNPGDLSTHITQRLSLGSQTAACTSGGALPAAALQSVRSSIGERGEAAARAELADAGLPAETAAALAATLANPVSTGSFAALARQQEGWETSGLGLLDGTNGLWRLRPCVRDGQDWVEITPADGMAAGKEICQILGLVPIA
jgi:hypothetical protein